MPHTLDIPEAAWSTFVEAAEKAKEAGTVFNGCTVQEIKAKSVIVARQATGSTVALTEGLVRRVFEAVRAGGGQAKRRSVDYTVAKESSVVNLHPRLGWSEDGDHIVIKEG